MEFSIATLLAQFTDDKSIAPKVLEKKLGVQEEELQKLQIALDALEKIGILVKDKGRYRRVSCEDTVEAKLRCSSKGFCFAIQDGEEAEDIYIRESHLSTAWNGDRVLVKVLKEGSRRRSPEGSVKLILERVNPSVLARVKPTPQGFRAVPLDDRLLFELELQSNGTDLAQAIDYLVHVEVVRYPLGSTPPLGRVARILGSDAEAAQDTDIVCCKHDLRRDFPPTVLQAADELSTKLGKAKLKDRLDLRSLLTVSFVPDEAVPLTYPIQNAFSLERTETGWQLGIHTVDVASAILTDSLLDREARRRGTTVYLGDTILPLFPETITPKAAFTPGEGRLAISVLLTVNDEGQVLQFEIQPTVVQVDHQLSHSHSSFAIDTPIEVASVMESLFEMAATIRRSRLAGGGWELKVDRQQPFQDRERLGAMAISTVDERQSLLGELLLLANQAIAFHVKALGIPCLYCVQGPPDAAELQDLLRLANNLGNDLDLKFELEQESTVLSSDYQRFTELFPKSRDPRILNYLLQLTLKPISYSVRPGHHFGLSTEGYTRVTKPMSRYGDLLMQRVLHYLFEDGRSSRKTNSKDKVNLRHSSSYGDISWNVLPPTIQQELESQLAAVVSQLSDREKTAADAEADLEGLQKAEQMSARTGEVFSGLITGVQSYGFFVEIEDLLVEGLVHVSSLKDDWYEFRSRHCCLVGRKNRTAYRLGDKVEVRVKSVDYYRQQIDLVTESRGSDASDEDLADE